MKHTIIYFFLICPLSVLAQGYGGMSEADMQKMMAQMQKIQACMGNVDQSQFQVLEQRQKAFQAEVKALCRAGQRAEAQKQGLSFAREVTENPAIKAMSRCGEMAKGMMPGMQIIDFKEELENQHICDSDLLR